MYFILPAVSYWSVSGEQSGHSLTLQDPEAPLAGRVPHLHLVPPASQVAVVPSPLSTAVRPLHPLGLRTLDAHHVGRVHHTLVPAGGRGWGP